MLLFKWSYNNTGSGGQVESAPTLADINSDGYLEVIALAPGQSKIYAFNYLGSLLWSYTPGSYPLNSCATADIDGDGFYEIIIGSSDNKVYAVNHDGSLLWSYTAGGAVYTSAVADINNNGWKEIVFGSTDSKVYALTHDGIFIWSYSIGPITDERQAPALADIDGDGYDEIIMGSYDWSNGKIYTLNHDGTLYWSYNIGGGIHCPPAVGDVDGDGWYEIVSPKITSSGVNALYCLNHDGSVCWTITLQRDIHDASIGDIDCDSCLEVVVGTYDAQYVYVLDDPNNTSGCTPVGVEERDINNVGPGIGPAMLRVYPNPFVQSTSINYQLPIKSRVSLKIYDISGQCVKILVDEEKELGYY